MKWSRPTCGSCSSTSATRSRTRWRRSRRATGVHGPLGAILADPAVVVRAIVADGPLPGNVLSFERDGRREVGYWIARELWGGGIASAALAGFLDVETRRPLYAGAARANAGSLRVLEKCGFAACGDEGDLVILRRD